MPNKSDFISWVELTLKSEKAKGEVTVRIVDIAEITTLNSMYRKQDKPTNVLSFPFEPPAFADVEPILGDIVICAEVVKNEADEQEKTLIEHFAHMTIHGVLHLLDYNHIDEAGAKTMEDKEIVLMQKLGFVNPYVE